MGYNNEKPLIKYFCIIINATIQIIMDKISVQIKKVRIFFNITFPFGQMAISIKNNFINMKSYNGLNLNNYVLLLFQKKFYRNFIPLC